MDYALERLKIEQIVVTERYLWDTSQWDKLRSFWHPDTSQTSVRVAWFNGRIDEHIAARHTTGDNTGVRSVKHFLGRLKHIIAPADVTSTMPMVLRSNLNSMRR